MKCAYYYCENEIDKANCIVSGIKEDTYWCSEECYQKHINGEKPGEACS